MGRFLRNNNFFSTLVGKGWARLPGFQKMSYLEKVRPTQYNSVFGFRCIQNEDS